MIFTVRFRLYVTEIKCGSSILTLQTAFFLAVFQPLLPAPAFSSTMFNTTLSPITNLYVNFTTLSSSGGTPPWYLFPVCVVAPYGFIFYFGVKVFNLAVGTPCNVLVIWQIATKKSDASTSDIFIFNLAILDTYFCLMTPIEMVNRLLLSDSRIWYFQRFAYGIKDVAPLFLVSYCVPYLTPNLYLYMLILIIQHNLTWLSFAPCGVQIQCDYHSQSWGYISIN